MFKEGKEYKTVGGWDVLVLWIMKNPSHVARDMVVVHKQYTSDETIAWHDAETGICRTNFSVNERPCFGTHPADILQF